MKSFIRRQISRLNKWSEEHETNDYLQVRRECESAIHDVRQKAEKLGIAEVVKLCQRSGKKGVMATRELLAECLAACPYENSAAEAAQQLGVSVETIYAACREGRLPHTPVGRRKIITPEQLQKYRKPGEVELPHLA